MDDEGGWSGDRRTHDFTDRQAGAALPLHADGPTIADFVDALFRYADPGTWVSLRAFYDDRDGVHGIRPIRLDGTLGPLTKAARLFATECANATARTVFAPPVATFTNDRQAREEDLANGLALSVECDQAPGAARAILESLLGPATVVVESGGEWPNPATGQAEPKLHLHWRLTEATRDAAGHALLKRARTLATALVGGDTSNQPAVHPIRWPGSWHRKREPRLARTVELTRSEVELGDAVEWLHDAADKAGIHPGAKASGQAGAAPDGTGEERETATLVGRITSGAEYHAPLVALAMRFLKAGMADGQVVQTLRGFMLAVPEALRDLKDGIPQPGRWQARYTAIPSDVRSARAKLGDAEAKAKAKQEKAPEPDADLGTFLNLRHWLDRKLDLPEPLLGDVITNTTRTFIGGQTGLGKTHLVMGMAAGMATGRGFLHWTASRPCRVAYIDGEMARDLVQERLADLHRRTAPEDRAALESNFFAFCSEDLEEIAERFPGLGEFGPLNTEAGQEFILRLLAKLGRIDAVFFDNRMSLLCGDMKEEQPWTDTMPLVKELTRRRIGQVWIDHTGHNTGQLYGTKTKEWQVDAVALLSKVERPDLDIAFSMEFPKARRRKPSNRADFAPVTVALIDDAWTIEGATGATGATKGDCRSLSPQDRTALGFLHDVLAMEGEPLPPVWGMAVDLRSVSLDRWEEECASRSLCRSDNPKNQRDIFNRAFKSLRDNHHLVAVRDGRVWATRTAL